MDKFTTEGKCPKCGSASALWRWQWGNVEEGGEEIIRVTCSCAYAWDTEPLDAS